MEPRIYKESEIDKDFSEELYLIKGLDENEEKRYVTDFDCVKLYGAEYILISELEKYELIQILYGQVYHKNACALCINEKGDEVFIHKTQCFTDLI